MELTTEEKFVELFRGRGDAYGHDEGRCVKERLTPEKFHDHLHGTEAIGVYPIVPWKGDFWVVWGCSDIDIEDIRLAVTLRDALKAAGVQSYIERSRSKGYHVWVFAESLVPARDMRRMFLAAHQVADIPPREVNPKQERLEGYHYGNYVRLPYFNGMNDDALTRRVVLDSKLQPSPLKKFVDYAHANRVSGDLIAEIGGLYREPERKSVVVDLEPTESVGEALSILSPLGKVIWKDGPLPNNDRSNTLAHLAHECVRSGLTPSQTKAVIVSADQRWGKYHLRTNGELEIDKLVVRVYQ